MILLIAPVIVVQRYDLVVGIEGAAGDSELRSWIFIGAVFINVIAHVQHKVVEESALMHDYIEPLLVKFNEMTGKYIPARAYEFTVQAEDYDSIKIHGRPKA